MLSKRVAQPRVDSVDISRLHKIISEQSVLRGQTFKLAFGGTTDIYFNMKKTMLHPEGANFLADAILEIIKTEPVQFIGGLAMGAIPIVTAVCMKSYSTQPIRAFYVRDEVKQHGTESLIEGHLTAGSKVVLVDDVTTTGSSVLKAVDAVEEWNCEVTKVITLVDRLEGAKENFGKRGIEFLALFTRHDFPSK